MKDFELQHLDHVAITVSDMETSAKWYEDVLGLKRYTKDAWGPYPIFLLAGETGIALFPSNAGASPNQRPPIRIDHFAFNATPENFEKARASLEKSGIDVKFQDHVYFHSIYFIDPDGHQVEITTLCVDASDFYEGQSQ